MRCNWSHAIFLPLEQEEVEIDAHTVERKGKLTMVVVHIRKKASKQLVAIGRQWMTFSSARPFESKL